MILILLSIILLLPCLLGFGKLFCTIFNFRLFEGLVNDSSIGVFGISLLYTALAFFIPLNLYVEIPTLLLGIFLFVKYKIYQNFNIFSKKEIVLLAISILIMIYCAAFPPYILDHFGYYVPSIQWLTEYGLVKGISNLDIVLGQMSIWHIFQAGFSNFSDPFLRINVLLLVIYLLYIIEKKNWIQLCFLPLLLLFSQSPSPDLPVIVFSLILLNEIIKGNKNAASIFAFSIFVFAIKPTMIWLPILSFLYVLFIVKFNYKSLIFGILILSLFFIKNIWTFGYPIFPVSLLDPHVIWKPNPELLQISSKFAILKTYDMQFSYEEIMQFSWFDYIKNWLFLNGIKSIINLFFIISLIIFTVFTIFKNNKIITFIYISIVIKSILVLLFSAQYRFFIDVFFVVFFLILYDFFTRKRSILFYSIFSLFIVGYITFPMILGQIIPSYRMSSLMGQFSFKQIYKPSIYQYKKFESYQVGNLKFNISHRYSLNFDTPTPAISESFVLDYQNAGIFPQLIDEKDISKGFIWKKLNKIEKLEVQNVILKIENTYRD